MQGSFASETLTAEEGFRIISEARQAVDMPILASVGVLGRDHDKTIETALQMVAAGADMVHFDLFYLDQPRSSDEALESLAELFALAARELKVPFGPKLNNDIPAHRFVQRFGSDAFGGVFLLDSIRVPPPLDHSGTSKIPYLSGATECSLFGPWQKPLTLQYTKVFAAAMKSDICAGGGLQNADDICEALIHGAACVQIATQIIVHGYDWIRKTNDRLAARLSKQGMPNISALRGLASRVVEAEGAEHAQPVRAVVHAEHCKPCGVCTRLAFCPFIDGGPNEIPTISDVCYGCGLCEIFCPQAGAIQMEPVT